jgi:gliding motility-associated-like protein
MNFSKHIFFIVMLVFPAVLFATHNRGGEITYVNLGGNSYEFTITTCTDVGSQAQADRDELVIDFGDGEMDTIPRVSDIGQPFDHQKNIYIGTHTYSSNGTFSIKVEDPNRNDGILNIYPGGGGSSDNVVFSLESTLVISPFFGNGNTSVQFDECPCPAIACVGNIYCYNPQAVDPDGDSLSYELVAPLGSGGAPLSIPLVYDFPHVVGGGTATLDQSSGTYCWDSPGMIGEFNFTIKITEWRNGYKVGHVLRDVQLTVQGNCTNTPPTVTAPDEICVTAGDNINFNVNASDPDGDAIELVATGLPFSVGNSATFPPVAGNTNVAGTFNWNTDCSNIKPGVYQVLFAVSDNGDPVFSNYTQTIITVLAPKVTGVTASAFGNGVNINWSQSICSNAEGYHIYRTTDPNFVLPDCCDGPDPVSAGFTQVGSTFGLTSTSFADNTSLTLGIDYCYVITAFYNTNQVESCPSDSACASLEKEVPIITHVTVNATDATSGIDSVQWSKPTELDTNQYPGPYHYKVYQGAAMNNINTFLGQTASAGFLYLTDTTFVVNGLNTLAEDHFYRVELYYTNSGNDSLVGTSNSAGSIFLTTVGSDNAVTLTWAEQVPWINTDYEISRALSSAGPFVIIDTVQVQTYMDTGLVNGVNYCYVVKSIGYYSSPSIINPLESYSQISCAVPVDLTPPCPPVLTIDGSCEFGDNMLTWNNPNNDCADDVMSYNLYYTPVEGEPFELIQAFSSNLDTTFTHNNEGSIAGCYYVTATDSVQYNNESDSSNVVCFDNCPIYELPNVFSPNGDGGNDLFSALIPYRYVKDIQIEIYNRWGQVVYSSTDPDVDWNGLHKETGTPVPDGVYYYLCTVNTIRLTGIEPVILTGFLHVFGNTGESSK